MPMVAAMIGRGWPRSEVLAWRMPIIETLTKRLISRRVKARYLQAMRDRVLDRIQDLHVKAREAGGRQGAETQTESPRQAGIDTRD